MHNRRKLPGPAREGITEYGRGAGHRIRGVICKVSSIRELRMDALHIRKNRPERQWEIL